MRLRLDHSFIQQIYDTPSAFYLLGSTLDVKDIKKEYMSLERENILVTSHIIKKIHVVSPLKDCQYLAHNREGAKILIM